MSHEEFLKTFGWSEIFGKPSEELSTLTLHPARVIREERALYRVQMAQDREVAAAISGKMQTFAKSRVDFPAVGDWVWIELSSTTDRATIHQIAPRKTLLQRRQVGASGDMQILSTNVDTVFITTSVNEDLNYQRIERYLAVVHDAGCVPVILLTKADIAGEKIREVLTNTEERFPKVKVFALSSTNFENAVFFESYLKPGTTSVVLGSSGVGKSTLVNYLIGEELIKTQGVREADGKGRHTTTSRNIHVSRFGGLIIDTPGMREVHLTDQEEGIANQFSDIEDLFVGCRFTNCQHESEPGCAVKLAIKNGTLREDRWLNYLKLEAEAQRVKKKLSAKARFKK